MNSKTIFYHIRVFGQLFKRDAYSFYKKSALKVAINYMFFTPTTTAFCFGYLMPRIAGSNPSPATTTIVIAGSCLWTLFLLSWSVNLGVLFDLHSDRFINYLITVAHPRVVLLEKIAFASAVSFVYFIPFFPMVKLILGPYFDISNVNMPQLIIILLLGSLFCGIFSTFFIFFIKSINKIGNFFLRINYPMLQLGGAYAPWVIVHRHSPVLANIIRANPMIYITEGVRRALIGGTEFFAFGTCVIMLLVFCALFMLMASYWFKKKLGHI